MTGRLGRYVPSTPRTESLIVGVLCTIVLLGLSRLDSTVFNNYVYLADAFLHHHVFIDYPGPRVDALSYNGLWYVIEGPLPGVLMIPLVAIFGLHANETAFTCVFGGITLGAAWYYVRVALPEQRDNVALLVAFFAFGTDLAWCAIYGCVWFTAHIVADAFLFFALIETIGKKRPWLVLLFILLAAESRFAVILAAVPLVPYALLSVPRDGRVRAVGLCAAVTVPFAVAYVAYDYARWGVWNDIGYTTWYHGDQIGEPTGSPFRLEYVPYELYSFFAWFPKFQKTFPFAIPQYSAVALTFTSPALLLAFFARGSWKYIVTLWLATILIFVPNVMYYANGGSQFGMRHALDFEPFLLGLMALAVGSKKVPQWAVDVLCGYSILVGIWGIWYWRSYYDPMLVHHIPGVN